MNAVFSVMLAAAVATGHDRPAARGSATLATVVTDRHSEPVRRRWFPPPAFPGSAGQVGPARLGDEVDREGRRDGMGQRPAPARRAVTKARKKPSAAQVAKRRGTSSASASRKGTAAKRAVSKKRGRSSPSKAARYAAETAKKRRAKAGAKQGQDTPIVPYDTARFPSSILRAAPPATSQY